MDPRESQRRPGSSRPGLPGARFVRDARTQTDPNPRDRTRCTRDRTLGLEPRARTRCARGGLSWYVADAGSAGCRESYGGRVKSYCLVLQSRPTRDRNSRTHHIRHNSWSFTRGPLCSRVREARRGRSDGGPIAAGRRCASFWQGPSRRRLGGRAWCRCRHDADAPRC
jgi:hypothetical protein